MHAVFISFRPDIYNFVYSVVIDNTVKFDYSKFGCNEFGNNEHSVTTNQISFPNDHLPVITNPVYKDEI